jgi:hypothetical protein
MKEIKFDNDAYLLPASWDELMPEQLIFLARLTEKKMTAAEIKLKMLLFVINGYVRQRISASDGDRYLISTHKRRYALSAEQLVEANKTFDYLFREVDNKTVLFPLLLKNPFPKVKCGCRTAIGPADGLTDITYSQFSNLQIWMTKLDSFPYALNTFISIIYKDSQGNAFSDKIYDMISPNVKTVIVWFYMGCMEFIRQKFPRVFSGESAAENIVDTQNRIIDMLAYNRLAEHEAVKNAPLYDALYNLEGILERHAQTSVKNH